MPATALSRSDAAALRRAAHPASDRPALVRPGLADADAVALGRSPAPVARVASAETFVVEIAGDGPATPPGGAGGIADRLRRPRPSTGPVCVAGAMPGDTLFVDVTAIAPLGNGMPSGSSCLALVVGSAARPEPEFGDGLAMRALAIPGAAVRLPVEVPGALVAFGPALGVGAAAGGRGAVAVRAIVTCRLERQADADSPRPAG